MEHSPVTSVRISVASFLRVVVVVLMLLLAWALRDILLLIILAMVLAAAIGPWISALQRRRVPRFLGVLIVYVGITAVILLIVGLLIPAVSHELTSLQDNFPQYASAYDRIRDFFTKPSGGTNGALTAAQDSLSSFSKGIFAGVRGFLGGVGSFVLVMVMTYYLIIDENNVREFWVRLAPADKRATISRLLNTVGHRIGQWFLWQIIIGAAIALLSYVGFLVIGLPDALLLSLIAAIASFVPILGTAIGVLPAVLVALTVSVPVTVIVLIFTIAVNWGVTNVFVPRILSRAVGLNPVVIILVMLLGAQLAGGIGLILAVPLATIVDAVIVELLKKREAADGTP